MIRTLVIRSDTGILDSGKDVRRRAVTGREITGWEITGWEITGRHSGLLSRRISRGDEEQQHGCNGDQQSLFRDVMDVQSDLLSVKIAIPVSICIVRGMCQQVPMHVSGILGQ